MKKKHIKKKTKFLTFKLFSLHVWRRILFNHVRNIIGLLDVQVHICGNLEERANESVLGPLNGVLNLERKVLFRASSNLLLRRVLGSAIILSQVRQNHLRIGCKIN